MQKRKLQAKVETITYSTAGSTIESNLHLNIKLNLQNYKTKLVDFVQNPLPLHHANAGIMDLKLMQ